MQSYQFALLFAFLGLILNSCNKSDNDIDETIEFQTDFEANSTTITVGDTVYFTDKSSDIADFWTWDFGDGNVTYFKNPSHIYLDEGENIQ